MSLGMTHDSQPCSNTVMQVMLKNVTLVAIGMDGLFHRRSNFQNAVLLFTSLSLDAIVYPRYLKSVTWFIGVPYTCSGGCGWQWMVINSVLGALITRPSSAAASAILVTWDWARGIEDSRRPMSSAKSRSLSILAGYLLDRRGQVTTPESGPDALPKRKSTKIINRRGAKTSPWRTTVVTWKGSEMLPSTIIALLELL